MAQPQEEIHQLSDSESETQSTISIEEMAVSKPVQEAMGFVRKVRDTYGVESEEYAQFHELMRDIKNNGVPDIKVVGSRIKLLFKEHPELVAGFNHFLPAGYEIIMENYPARAAVEFNDAVAFVNKIKTEYTHDENRYKSFLDILNDHHHTNKALDEVLEKVRVLFHDRPYLVKEFVRFLPDALDSVTTKAVYQTKLNRLSSYLRNTSSVVYLTVFCLLLSLGVAFWIEY